MKKNGFFFILPPSSFILFFGSGWPDPEHFSARRRRQPLPLQALSTL
jgi:hypothetical protein